MGQGPLRTSDNVDILLIGGPQGSGKSSLATGWFRDRRRVNRDEIRVAYHEMVTGRDWRASDWSAEMEPLVTEIEMATLRHELGKGRRVVIDNTIINERLREPYIALAAELGKTIGCVFLALPLEYCREKNQARERTIPDAVLADFHRQMTIPKPAEGLSFVQVLNRPVPLH